MYIEITYRVKLILIALSILLPIYVSMLFFLLFSKYHPLAPGERIVEIVPPFIPLITYKPLYYSITIAIILGLLPLAIVHTINMKHVNSMEMSIPSFMKTVSEAIKSGIPYLKAIEESSKRGFGVLGKEIGKCMVRVGLGEDFKEAVRAHIAKFKHSLIISRALTILAALYGSGGDVANALDTSAQVLSDIIAFNEEKKANMKPYMLIIYLAVILVTFLSFILIKIFINTLFEMAKGAGVLLAPRLSLKVVEALFYYLAIIEAVFGGLIAGKIYEGRIIGGLIHIVILLTIVLISHTIIFPFLEGFIRIP